MYCLALSAQAIPVSSTLPAKDMSQYVTIAALWKGGVFIPAQFQYESLSGVQCPRALTPRNMRLTMVEAPQGNWPLGCPMPRGDQRHFIRLDEAAVEPKE